MKINFPLLQGKRGLVVGIANHDSIATGCARAFKAAGAELALTYLNEKAKPYVQPVADELDAAILMPLDVQDDSQMDALFDKMESHFDSLIDEARERAPQHRLVSIDDVGNMAMGLVSDAACNVTGNISYIDAGYHVMS